MEGPVLVHLLTVKGKGYERGEHDPRTWHAVTPFEPQTGEVHKKSSGASYTSVFANTLIELAQKDEKIVAITAAMPDGTASLFIDLFGKPGKNTLATQPTRTSTEVGLALPASP